MCPISNFPLKNRYLSLLHGCKYSKLNYIRGFQTHLTWLLQDHYSKRSTTCNLPSHLITVEFPICPSMQNYKVVHKQLSVLVFPQIILHFIQALDKVKVHCLAWLFTYPLQPFSICPELKWTSDWRLLKIFLSNPREVSRTICSFQHLSALFMRILNIKSLPRILSYFKIILPHLCS